MSDAETAHPAAVRIFAGSQRVTVAGGAPAFAVDGPARVTIDADWYTVDEVSGPLTVRVPDGTDLVVGSSSGRIEVTGTLGAVSVTSESGRVTIAAAASVDVRTSTSRVEVGEVRRQCRVRTDSGRVSVRRCGSADVSSRSARIDLRSVHGHATAHAVTGSIDLVMDVAADVDAETVSGRVHVSLPAGTVVSRVTGDRPDAPPAAADCTVRARSHTGRVEVTIR